MITRDEAKEKSLKKMICRQSQIPFLRLIDEIYDGIDKLKEEKGKLLAEIFDMQLEIDEIVKG